MLPGRFCTGKSSRSSLTTHVAALMPPSLNSNSPLKAVCNIAMATSLGLENIELKHQLTKLEPSHMVGGYVCLRVRCKMKTGTTCKMSALLPTHIETK